MTARAAIVEQRLASLVSGFNRYVESYDRLTPFDARQLAAHRETITLRRRAGTVEAAIHDTRFVDSLRSTLKAWGIGVRASRLTPEDEFTRALHSALPGLTALEPFSIDSADLPDDTASRLLLIIESLGIVENQAKLVASAKVLHHLLPDLVPPIDRKWTGDFFGFHPPEWQSQANQRRIFREIYDSLAHVARQTHPQQYVTAQGWRTSRTKILDNALIGFCKVELARQLVDVTGDASEQISFDVEGLPPAKNEALSMLGAGHPHAPRVYRLLEAAQRAQQESGFPPNVEGSIALDVVVRASQSEPPWDATNYLGGIADVLEDKSHRGPLPHLGQHADVCLYRNDRQIKEISYREVEADGSGYTVTIRRIAPYTAATPP